MGLALAVIETDTHHGPQAEKHLRASIDVLRSLWSAHPDRPLFGERLGACLKQLGDLFKSEGRSDEAVTAYREAQQLQRRLVADHSTVLHHRRNLAATCINLGNLQNRNGQSALADGDVRRGHRALPGIVPFDARRQLQFAA